MKTKDMINLITVYRVYVSEVCATFREMETALSYLRAEATESREPLVFESVRMMEAQYLKEVATQEKEQS